MPKILSNNNNNNNNFPSLRTAPTTSLAVKNVPSGTKNARTKNVQQNFANRKFAKRTKYFTE